jgi:hypothetical protein
MVAMNTRAPGAFCEEFRVVVAEELREGREPGLIWHRVASQVACPLRTVVATFSHGSWVTTLGSSDGTSLSLRLDLISRVLSEKTSCLHRALLAEEGCSSAPSVETYLRHSGGIVTQTLLHPVGGPHPPVADFLWPSGLHGLVGDSLYLVSRTAGQGLRVFMLNLAPQGFQEIRLVELTRIPLHPGPLNPLGLVLSAGQLQILSSSPGRIPTLDLASGEWGHLPISGTPPGLSCRGAFTCGDEVICLDLGSQQAHAYSPTTRSWQRRVIGGPWPSPSSLFSSTGPAVAVSLSGGECFRLRAGSSPVWECKQTWAWEPTSGPRGSPTCLIMGDSLYLAERAPGLQGLTYLRTRLDKPRRAGRPPGLAGISRRSYPDICFTVDGTTLHPAHRVILARYPTLAALFDGHPGRGPIPLACPGLTPGGLELLLDFFYGDLNPTGLAAERLLELWGAGLHLRLDGLCSSLVAGITPQQAASIVSARWEGLVSGCQTDLISRQLIETATRLATSAGA